MMLTEDTRTGHLPVTNRKSKSIKRDKNQITVVNPASLSDITSLILHFSSQKSNEQACPYKPTGTQL
jgi:hypothetical protein